MSHYSSLGTLSRASHKLNAMATTAGSLDSQETECRRLAQIALNPFGETLPATKSFELYLVRGLFIPLGGSEKDLRVVYTPEFVFVLDVGYESLVGVSYFWNTMGSGDPRFPDPSAYALRSITARKPPNIIYPNIAGSIMIGVKDGVPDDEVRAGLEGAGLRNIQGSDWFWTAQCVPFNERRICTHLESSLSFIKYAEPDSLQRIIDFSPGWSCIRLT